MTKEMELEIAMQKRTTGCNSSTWIKSLFLVQGVVLTAVGFVGLISCTSPDVECVRLKYRYMLILLCACLHVIVSVVCCIQCKNVTTTERTFVATVLWSCVISGLITFQTIRLYEYKQAISPHVLYSIIMTGVLNILVILVCCLNMWELCKRKEKSEHVQSLLV